MALLLGLFAVLVTPREDEPQINLAMVNALIPFPGASNSDVQSLVARPAGQRLGQIADIEHTTSAARPGLAVLTLQFKMDVSRTDALVRLYGVLNAHQRWLPAGLVRLPPIVRPKGIDDVPVLGITLWAQDQRSADRDRCAHAGGRVKTGARQPLDHNDRRPRPGGAGGVGPNPGAGANSHRRRPERGEETRERPGVDPPVPGMTMPHNHDPSACPTPSTKAILTDTSARTDLLNRLKRAEGQLRGIQRMVETGGPCPDIAGQMAAVRKALNSACACMTICFMQQASQARLAPDGEREAGLTAIIDNVQILLGKLR